jgi:hypothetical protein
MFLEEDAEAMGHTVHNLDGYGYLFIENQARNNE